MNKTKEIGRSSRCAATTLRVHYLQEQEAKVVCLFHHLSASFLAAHSFFVPDLLPLYPPIVRDLSRFASQGCLSVIVHLVFWLVWLAFFVQV